MKKKMCIVKKLLSVFVLVTLVAFLGCGIGAGDLPSDYQNTTNNTNEKNDSDNHICSDSYFWGTWVRMDNGKQYEVLEDKVIFEGRQYSVISSASTELQVKSLGTFKKESDSVIINGNIPYFRNGGANLEYSLKLVGFTEGAGRAASSSISGIKGKSKSEKYTSFTSEGESESDGTITFTAPTANDTQTVTIENGTDLVVIPGLKINNKGDYMGTVALVGEDDYNLKITGVISEDQKDDGYLYGNNAKVYDMVITITNVSKNNCSSSICIIESQSPAVTVLGENLSGITISTLKPNATKEIKVKVVCSDLSEAYIDTGINVTIRNPKTKQEWADYIPLRFFKGLIPITVAAQNPEENNEAALNGFIIYPDGNNQFFSVKNNSSSILMVPTFGNNGNYMMVFSGATVTSELSDSTEMYYSVAAGSSKMKDINLSVGWELLESYMTYGGDNNSENNAYFAHEDFTSYLSEGEIDYYTITADSEEFYAPGAKNFCQVTYESEYATVPTSFYIPEGNSLSAEKLPVLEEKGMSFLGWYDGNIKVTNGYRINSDTKLTAKWQISSYKIEYKLNGGTNAALNQTVYTVMSDTISLLDADRNGYTFEGWYITEDFTGNPVLTIESGSVGNITLYAKWTPVIYTITYYLNGGENASENPNSYTVENKTTVLAEPIKEGYYFDGWYVTEDFSGDEIEKIESGSYGNITLYAKWLKECTVTYVSDYGTVPQSIKVGEGNKITIDQLPVLETEGKYFAGWYAGETIIEDGKYTVTDDVTLTARWINKYQVSYVSDYGTVPQLIEVAEGSLLDTQALPQLAEKGWKFIGWYADASYTQKVETGYFVNINITLYAKWEEKQVLEDDFVFVEGGTVVGSNSYNQYYSGAFPEGRTVTLSDYYMSPYEVTKKLYEEVMIENIYGLESDPSDSSHYPNSFMKRTCEIDSERAVETVTWYDAIYFCNLYSEQEGLEPVYTIEILSIANGHINSAIITADHTKNGYRLPTEAEWEYAARGGKETYGTTVFANYFAGTTTTNYYDDSNFVLDGFAWYGFNTCNDGMTGDFYVRGVEGSGAHQVGLLAPNALGLYDMSGNVWEWCYDLYGSINTGIVSNPMGELEGDRHVFRGGCWVNEAYFCSVINRNFDVPSDMANGLGFRLVRSAPRENVVITYSTEHSIAPESVEIIKNGILVEENLPQLTENGWKFFGWYTDASYTQKVEEGYEVKTNITLYAKWEEKQPAADNFVFVEGGTFNMGEGTAKHSVTVGSFYMCPYEVTQEEYEQYGIYGGPSPSSTYGVGNNYPAYNVSWYDALVYCNKRSIAEGLTPCYTINGSTNPSDWGNGSIPSWSEINWDSATCDFKASGYRLPTEAEWEYAARGGKYKNEYTYSGSNSIDDVAWYYYNSGYKTHTVGGKTANNLGIYDMSGNVREWCWDWYGNYSTSAQTNPTGAASGSSRVRRGGSWYDSSSGCSVSSRYGSSPYSRDSIYGFRLVRSAQ
ncbi:MAG: SUMF1/EgtB/PvdO family nonheme iron enzyme [Treponema sp.]|nr:SUMF1/EgtB/PvdO family nonheme iron enzyme [Treponema sp.]